MVRGLRVCFHWRNSGDVGRNRPSVGRFVFPLELDVGPTGCPALGAKDLRTGSSGVASAFILVVGFIRGFSVSPVLDVTLHRFARLV